MGKETKVYLRRTSIAWIGNFLNLKEKDLKDK